MHANLLFINDAPTAVALGVDDKSVSRIQVAKTGKFIDPRYGKFAITRQDFAKWMTNFATLSLADGHLGLPVDVDHAPEKKGDTEAVGWVTSLDTMGADGKTPNPDQLWGVVEWNSVGVELVADRRYAYISPSYQHNFRDETGKTHGTALVGAALTNRPFLDMATVSLSTGDFVVATEEVSDSPNQMPELKNIALALGLAEDADESAIVDAIKASPEQKTLDALAKDEGKVVLEADTMTTLMADAAAGRDAATTLAKMAFTNAFDQGVREVRLMPAERESYEALYGVNAEATLSAMAARPKMLSTELIGSDGSAGETVSTKDADGFSVDEDREALHRRATTLSAEKDIPYGDAVMLAASEVTA